MIALLLPALLSAFLLLAPAAAAPAPGDAHVILAQAKSEAAAQHKNILVVFSASWCGPCHLFEKFLTDPATGPIMNKNFVIVRLDVGEQSGDTKHHDTPGAVDYETSLAGKEPGFPWLVVLTPDGKPIINSYRSDHGKKDNIGYPAVPVEVDWFMQMMHKGAPALSPADDGTVQSWLQAREQK